MEFASKAADQLNVMYPEYSESPTFWKVDGKAIQIVHPSVTSTSNRSCETNASKSVSLPIAALPFIKSAMQEKSSKKVKRVKPLAKTKTSSAKKTKMKGISAYHRNLAVHGIREFSCHCWRR
jgi:hypothetical protein